MAAPLPPSPFTFTPSLPFTPSPPPALPLPPSSFQSRFFSGLRLRPSVSPSHPCPPRPRQLCCRAYRVEIEHDGETHVLEVAEDETILQKALESDLQVPHDCKLGVCMTCPAKLEHGVVDQSGAMLSDDVVEQGYALLCCSMPRSDCKIRTIPEEELLSLQLVTSQL